VNHIRQAFLSDKSCVQKSACGGHDRDTARDCRCSDGVGGLGRGVGEGAPAALAAVGAAGGQDLLD
jgi:hypothetical protein